MPRPPASFKVFFFAFIAFALSAQIWSHAVSLTPHYVYLAYSLLQRHVDLIQLPPTTYDLLHFNGRWFVAGSPMPAIMMLPFVAIFGVGFSDVLFSVVLSAIDVALVYALLGIFIGSAGKHSERSAAQSKSATPQPPTPPLQGSAQDATPGLLSISESARRWITLLFALGTPFWYLASLGTYWFTAHIVVVFFALLATREALTRQRWFLVGLWLVCAGLARGAGARVGARRTGPAGACRALARAVGGTQRAVQRGARRARRRGQLGPTAAGRGAMLDGSRSFFRVEGPDAALVARCAAFDVHPSGPLHGRGASPATGEAGAIEAGVTGAWAEVCALLESQGLEHERRALRLPVRGLEWSLDDDRLSLAFELPRGAFATAVLHEILADAWSDPGSGAD